MKSSSSKELALFGVEDKTVFPGTGKIPAHEHCQMTEVFLLTTSFAAGAPKSKERRAVPFLQSYLLPCEFPRPSERVSIDENLSADLSNIYSFDLLPLQKAFTDGLDGSGMAIKKVSLLVWQTEPHGSNFTGVCAVLPFRSITRLTEINPAYL